MNVGQKNHSTIICLDRMITSQTRMRNNPLSASVALKETSQLICAANQLIGFYMRATLALNGLNNEWLKKGNLSLHVEGYICAIQEEEINTRYLKSKRNNNINLFDCMFLSCHLRVSE